MNSEQKMVREFHEKFGHRVGDTPEPLLVLEEQSLRLDLIQEELDELSEAFLDRNVVEIADALADLLYVVYGTAVCCGIDMAPLFKEVHRSNMAKVWPDGEVHYHDNGKVAKPWDWTEPDLASIIAEQRGKNA